MRRIRVGIFNTISRAMSTNKNNLLTIYVLRLNNDKWYIGKTNDINKRLAAHKSGSGSAWTREHKPIEIYNSFEGDNFDEDKTTKQYMSEYGIDNVRGGSYVTMKLSKEQKASIMSELKMADDKCMKCGKKGHFAKECKKKKICARCGRNNHYVSNCYAKTTETGKELLEVPYECIQCNKTIYTADGCDCDYRERFGDVSHCKRCGRKSHKTSNCYARADNIGRVLVKQGKEYICTKCGNVVYHNEGCDCGTGSIPMAPLIRGRKARKNKVEEIQCNGCIVL